MTRNSNLLHDICDQLGGWEDGQPEPSIDVDGTAIPISTALGQLWHDTDLLPASLRSRVTDFVDRRQETITTYASAAHALMPVVKDGIAAFDLRAPLAAPAALDIGGLAAATRGIAGFTKSQHDWLFGRLQAMRTLADEATIEELALGNIDQAEAEYRQSIDEITLTRADFDAVLAAMGAASECIVQLAAHIDHSEKRTEEFFGLIEQKLGPESGHVVQ